MKRLLLFFAVLGPLYGEACFTAKQCLYVNTAGSDASAGGFSAPFLTIQKAVDTFAASPASTNVIIVQNGAYGAGAGHCTTTGGDGTPNANAVNITTAFTSLYIRSENRGGAVVSGIGCQYYFNISSVATNVTIDGFAVTNTYWGGIGSQGTNITLLRNHIYNVGNVNDQATTRGHSAIVTLTGGNNTLIDSGLFHDNGRTNSTCGGPACPALDNVISAQGTNVSIINNIFYNFINGWPVQLKTDGNALVANNTFYGPAGSSKRGHIVVGDGSGSGYHDFTVRNNISRNPAVSSVVLCNVALAGANAVDHNNYSGAGVTGVLETGTNSCPSQSTGLGTITEASEVAGDPLLIGPPNNFRVKMGSPTIAAGVVISQVTSDYEAYYFYGSIGEISFSRLGAKNDIGAYWYPGTLVVSSRATINDAGAVGLSTPAGGTGTGLTAVTATGVTVR